MGKTFLLLSFVLLLGEVHKRNGGIHMEENVTQTHLTNTIEVSPTTTYDETAKELLSDKNLLAHILAGVVEEFEGWEIQEIIPCIEGEPLISKVSVDAVPCISGSNTEDSTVKEGKITYDIRFDVIIPAGVGNKVIGIKLLIDVEMQNKATGLRYKLLNRATYSVARMISSQKNKEFVGDDYEGIKKVYSIWICASPEARYRNTIFTSPLSSNEKIKRLENVYNIPSTEIIKGGVAKMCNLSSGILEEGIAKGKAQEQANGISILINTLRGLKQTDAQITELLVEKYSLSAEEATMYMEECL